MTRDKKSLVVYGNCQAGCIRGFLRRVEAFDAGYELAVLPGVHEIAANQIDTLHDAVRAADVFIHQHVSSAYRGASLSSEFLLGLLKPGAVRLSYPSLYFGPYFPNLTYLNDSSGAMLRGPGGDYHDIDILRSFSLGEPIAAAVARLEDVKTYQATSIVAALDSWLLNMKQRERSLDIHASNFIGARYREERLFYVYNHPLNIVMLDICGQVAKALGLQFELGALMSLPNWLSSTAFPIHPSVHHALGLRFPLDTGFTIKSAKISPRDAVERFFGYYTEYPQAITAFRKKFDTANNAGRD